MQLTNNSLVGRRTAGNIWTWSQSSCLCVAMGRDWLQANIVCPNKHTAQAETMYKGHLLESETYIGGKVEALESGVFRSDLPMRFKCKPEAYQVT